MRYTLSHWAKSDLDDIAEWTARDSPTSALRVIRELRAEFRGIADNPMLLRPEIGEDARLAVCGRYVILFWVDVDAVRFERVVYGGRDLPTLY